MDDISAGADMRRQNRTGTTPLPLSWIVVAVGSSLVLLGVLLEKAGLSIALNQAAAGFGLAGVVLLAARNAFARQGPYYRPALRDAAENVLLFVTISLAGAVASYGVAALTHGWVDADLERFDTAIGFNWNALYALTAAHGWLQMGGRIVYASIFASPAILLLSFASRGQRAEARSFIASFWLAAVTCLILFHWLPTLGPLAYMWHKPIVYMPTSGLAQADLIPLLRERHAGPIDLAHLQGLVGPPSFHAASAVLYILAAWKTPHLRWPLTVLNGLMLLAVPVEGTHYATDVVSGMTVAIASWSCIRWIEHRLGRGMAGFQRVRLAPA